MRSPEQVLDHSPKRPACSGVAGPVSSGRPPRFVIWAKTKIDLSREAVVARLRMASDLPSRLGSCLKKQESSCSAVLNLHIDVYLQCSTFLRQ